MLARYENKVRDIRETIINSLKEITEASILTLEAYKDRDNAKFSIVKEQLLQLQSNANSLDNEIIKTFALFGPEAQELRMLVSYLKMNNEFVRIGEGIKKYAKRMQEHCKGDSDLEPLDATIILLHKSSINALNYITQCFEDVESCDVEDTYRKVMVEESQSDDLFAILEKDILKQITKGEELSMEYVKVLMTLRKLERACDRSVNVAKLMVYAERGGEMKIYEN
ncbi:MAG: PhoU domain-containing protein [Campylobacterota bacterium]|nr:PhoU domain-containing protein [Campylobacterota bacterium]